MAAQTDLQAGLDPTSLNSVTFAQLLQMINQMSPQFNIGLIICQAGPSLNSPLTQGVGGAPDVTNNPRFSRYTWLNTYLTTEPPTPYTYNSNDGKWYASTISPSTVFDSTVAVGANIQINKLLPGTARWIVRTNAAGNSLEFINPNAIFAAGDIPLTALDVSGAPGSLSLLQRSAAGVVSWSVLNVTGSVTNLAVASLAPAVVNTYILQTVGGVAVWVASNAFLQDFDVTLSKLNLSGAASGDSIVSNGTNWVKKTTPYVNSFYHALVAGDKLSGTAAGGTGIFPAAGLNIQYRVAHDLGDLTSVTYNLRVVAYCTSADAAYAVGDEVDVTAFFNAGAGTQAFSYAITQGGASVNVAVNNGTAINVISPTGQHTAVDPTKWGIRINLAANG